MKVIKVRPAEETEEKAAGYEIRTPWLRADDAARYLQISRAFFDKAAAASHLRYGWQGRCKVYNTRDLDRLCLGEACDEGEGSAAGRSDPG